ncbi:chorismate mutase [Cypionkella sp.]|jgi:isochorismate pyruvate lyase|uniref:chorismate mutase n=1 Tax=Cypionkella sp. TaxID=2811411 RepID=UPI003753A2B5
MKSPADCADMKDIRAEIDRLDHALMALFAERVGYIDRAAQIKQVAALPARITARVEEVIANVRDHAERLNLPPEPYERLWRELIDWSIAREEAHLSKELPNDR